MRLWVLPAIVTALAAVPLFVTLRHAKAEAAALRAELAQLVALRGPVQALGVELRQLQGEVGRRRLARPGSSAAP